MNFLEVTVEEDDFRKRVVEVKPEPEGERAEGYLATTVPDGDLTLVTCALVNCPGDEIDLLCGKVKLPAQIAVDRIHEITYSTEHTCQDQIPLPSFVKHPSVNGSVD